MTLLLLFLHMAQSILLQPPTIGLPRLMVTNLLMEVMHRIGLPLKQTVLFKEVAVLGKLLPMSPIQKAIKALLSLTNMTTKYMFIRALNGYKLVQDLLQAQREKNGRFSFVQVTVLYLALQDYCLIIQAKNLYLALE